jgi:hypothetical protein
MTILKEGVDGFSYFSLISVILISNLSLSRKLSEEKKKKSPL